MQGWLTLILDSHYTPCFPTIPVLIACVCVNTCCKCDDSVVNHNNHGYCNTSTAALHFIQLSNTKHVFFPFYQVKDEVNTVFALN